MTDVQDLRPLLSAVAEARQRRDVDSERKLLDEGLAKQPDNLQLLNARGMRALGDGEPRRAVEVLSRATKLDPLQAVLWLNLAGAYRALDDADGEQDALEQALDIDRVNFAGQIRMAQLLQRRGRTVGAVQHWTNVLSMAAGMGDLPENVRSAVDVGRTFVEEHNRRVSSDIETLIGGELHADPAHARRFTACVEHSLGRRKIYQNECAGIHFPFLPADEYFDRSLFPWLPTIEAQTAAIREEALALLKNGGEVIRPYVRQEKGLPENKWSALDQSLDWSACFLWEYGVKNEAVCERCPATAAALEALPRSHIPGKAPSAFFSILKPRTHIPSHTGVTNTRAIIHLPLVVPDGCRFRVGGETRIWEEGKALAFDDTIDHEAWNDSDEVRIVLIFDAWNPYLTPVEQDWLVRLFAITESYAS